MYREIKFTICDADKVYIHSDTFVGYYKGRRLYAGKSGEDEATQLAFYFNQNSNESNFEGFTATLYLNGTSVTSQALSSDVMELEYEIPDTYMVPEVIKAQIVLSDGTQTFKTRLIYLEVERCL